MKTPAAILVEQKAPLEFGEVEIPVLSYGQVLVQVDISRICGSQVGEIDGVKGPDRWLPHLLGHEGCGTVLEVGPEVTTVRAGDRVVLHWRPGAGIESRPPVYSLNGERVNAGFVTTFNRHCVVSENRLTVVPQDIDKEFATLLADTLTTGIGIVNRDSRVEVGESVVVIGSGGIGLGVLLGAKLAGAYPIIAVDLFDHKLDVATKVGATHTINSKYVPDWPAAVREIVGSSGPDVVIDGTGNAGVIQQAYQLSAREGRTVLFGVPAHNREVTLHTLPLHFGKTLRGSEGGASLPHIDIPRYVRMHQAGLMDTSNFVSHRCKLEEVNESIAKMRAGEVVHAMIVFDD